MVKVNVTIKNLPEIRRAFSQAPHLTVRYVNKAIARSLIQIERSSKMNAPVRTGYLRASHTTRLSNLRGEIEPMAKYAIYVHEGTRFMRSRPFLFDAVKDNEKFVEDEFEKAVQNVLDDIGRSV